MKSAESDRRVFRGILRAVASEEFSMQDYKSALADLRSGELAAVLENVMRVLSGEVISREVAANRTNAKKHPGSGRANIPERASKPARKASNASADQLFDDVRRRKLTRDAVESYIASLNRDFAQRSDSFETMRMLLHGFKDRASQREWELLHSLINGDYERDPYMQRIVAG